MNELKKGSSSSAPLGVIGELKCWNQLDEDWIYIIFKSWLVLTSFFLQEDKKDKKNSGVDPVAPEEMEDEVRNSYSRKREARG